jgi:hypothetical protein
MAVNMFNPFPLRWPTGVAAGLVLFLAVCPGSSRAQGSPSPPSPECPQATALLSVSNPAYSDAMELAHQLENYGFVVHCIFPTKLGSIFQVVDGNTLRSTVEGEANFTTNYGSFDVIFLPKPQTFRDFKITERRKDGGYLYRFTGTPQVWAGDKFKFGSAFRQGFLKHENQLFFVADDKLRARLEQALHLAPQM